MEIRLHFDESVTTVVVRALHQRGVDVTTPVESNLVGATDEDQLANASSANRVLVTHDSDFLRLHEGGATHAGIAYCHQRKYSPGQLLQSLLLLHSC